MATPWTDITNAQVAAGAPVTTSLMTSLRDRLLAAAEQAAGAPGVTGWMRRLECIKDTAASASIEFTSDISGYKEVCIDFIGVPSSAVKVAIEVREAGGTWRRVATSAQPSGVGDLVMFRCWVSNIDAGINPGVDKNIYAYGFSGTDTNGIVTGNVVVADDATGFMGGYSLISEDISEIRVLPISGSFSNSGTNFAQAVLYGISAITDEAVLP